jgi:hypothetical protein
MKARHRATLIAIFADPVRADIEWRSIEALMLACEGAIKSVRRFLSEAGIIPKAPRPDSRRVSSGILL